MTVYHGIVRGSHIEIEGNERLTEGTPVEVRPRANHASDQGAASEPTLGTEGLSAELAAEARFKQQLRAEGRLAPEQGAKSAPHVRHFLNVQGQPLSEQIILERR